MAKRNAPARPGAKPTSGRSPEKYRRILDAAIHVIAANGYHNSRVSDIAECAGVADGTIYLYFANKEQILMAAIDSAFESFLALAREEVAKAADPREKLRRIAFLHLDMLGKKRDLATVFQTELRQSAKFIAQFSRSQLIEYFDLIRSAVREGQQAGLFRTQLSDKIAANCFYGALDEMVTSWLLSDHDYPLGGAADAVVDVILAGMETRARS
jgi:TetR/AcrR family fatty acid metabolism transcriptional regulator